MIQKAIVKKQLTPTLAQIEVQRKSACSHDCSKCSGCGTPQTRILATAHNPIGATAGDTVIIEGDTKQILGFAALVYATPLLLFFICYALTQSITHHEGFGIGAGLLGFLIGIGFAIWYNHHMHTIPFTIIQKE